MQNAHLSQLVSGVLLCFGIGDKEAEERMRCSKEPRRQNGAS